MAQFTQIDYDLEMALIADDRQGKTLGVVRLIRDPLERNVAEFSLLVATSSQGKGLGRLLLNKAVAYSKEAGITILLGDVMKGNRRMLRFCEKYGFQRDQPEIDAASHIADDDLIRISLSV